MENKRQRPKCNYFTSFHTRVPLFSDRWLHFLSPTSLKTKREQTNEKILSAEINEYANCDDSYFQITLNIFSILKQKMVFFFCRRKQLEKNVFVFCIEMENSWSVCNLMQLYLKPFVISWMVFRHFSVGVSIQIIHENSIWWKVNSKIWLHISIYTIYIVCLCVCIKNCWCRSAQSADMHSILPNVMGFFYYRL